MSVIFLSIEDAKAIPVTATKAFDLTGMRLPILKFITVTGITIIGRSTIIAGDATNIPDCSTIIPDGRTIIMGCSTNIMGCSTNIMDGRTIIPGGGTNIPGCSRDYKILCGSIKNLE